MDNVTKGLSRRDGKGIGLLNIILSVQIVAYTALALAVPSLVNAAVFNVPAGDVGKLIEAIDEANTNFESDNIVLEAGIYTLTASLPIVTSVITFSVVDLVGKARIERAANAPSFRIFEIASTASVALISIDIVGGNASAAGGIRNEGLLIFSNGVVSNNTADFSDGGGITNIGTLIINNSTISDNKANRDGAGILNVGSMTIFNSTISGNSAAVNGGGLENAFDVSSGKSGTMNLNNVTITNNRADADSSGGGNGGGISNCPGCTARLKNTIIADNFDSNIVPQAPDCSGTLTSEGFNLLGDNANCNFVATTGDRVGISDPRLGILRDNGGATPTHALLSPLFGDSPAIDTGNPAAPGSGGNACELIDQRGFKRPVDGDSNGVATCDIGAFEFGAEPPVVNNLVSFAPLTSTFDTSAAANGCPANFVGKFNFVATITNDSTSPAFSGLVVQVRTLTNGNVLLNADAGPGGFDATLTVPRRDGFSDGILGPGEFVDIPFVICLRNTAPFTFLVDLLGAQ